MSDADRTGLPAGYVLKPQYEVTPREAREMLARGEIVIVDVRRADELAKARLEGSLHVPLTELETKWTDAVEDATGKRIVTMCHHGVRSMQAMLFLRQMGAADAMSMAGGIDAWSAGVDAAVPRYGK